MNKRIVSLILIVLVVPLFLVSPSSAASIVNYDVYAVAQGNVSGQSAQSILLSPGQTRTYMGSNNGGISIRIPASQQSGYLFVVGIHPVTTTVSGSGWYSPSSYYQLNPTYYFSSTMSTVGQVNSGAQELFTGVVYVPAHTDAVYLNIIIVTNSSTGYVGGTYLSNGRMYFVPDTGDSGTVTSLEVVIQELQQIQQTVQSSPEQDADSQQLLDEIQSLLDEIEELVTVINDNTYRPPPDDILPSMPPSVLPPSDEAAVVGRDAIVGIMSSEFMVGILLLVFTLAFVRYVLFGKAR